MANFKTHISVAAAVSGILAIGCLGGGIAARNEVLLYFTLGTIGGILPDVDADNSIPVRFLFSSLAIIFSFLMMFSKIDSYSLIELALLWMVSYLVIKYVVFNLFTHFTIHRGVFHSLLAALFFGFCMTSICYHFVNLGKFISWMAGAFIILGYCVHLLLDEMYSVNLLGLTIKKSFGTAIKPISIRYYKATVVLLLATLAVYYTTPRPDLFFHTLLDAKVYHKVKTQLLPKAGWFKL
jgi:hypothetical protein